MSLILSTTALSRGARSLNAHPIREQVRRITTGKANNSSHKLATLSRERSTQPPIDPDAHSMRGKDVTILSGSGMIGRKLGFAALEQGDTVVACASKGSIWDTAAKTTELKGRLIFVPIDYEEGNDPKAWEEVVNQVAKQEPSHIRGVNTRGVGTKLEGQTFKETIVNPAVAFAEGLTKGAENVSSSMVQCGSIVCQIQGFHETDDYAAARLETTRKLAQIVENGANFSIDYVIHQKESDSQAQQPNHSWCFDQLTRVGGSIGQFKIGDESTLAIQPISEDQLIEGMISKKLQNHAFTSIPGVGPRAYTVEETYEFFTNVTGKKLRMIDIPYQLANWIGKYAPLGHISEYSVGLIKHRMENPETNKPHCHKQLESLISGKLKDLDEMLEESGSQSFKSPHSLPILEHVNLIRKTLTYNKEARDEFFTKVLPNLPTLVRNVILG
ncbi:MAG: hypothetical protein S4CHLAM20_03650 [Chlamydiia bacterium]|nr:hypothetical protein [Chlamydiia bacterium]